MFRRNHFALHWRHNGHYNVSNHQPHDCLLNRLFRRRSKENIKLCVTGLCARNSLETGEFPAQMASNAENVSIWWRHHGYCNGCSPVYMIAFWVCIVMILNSIIHLSTSLVTIVATQSLCSSNSAVPALLGIFCPLIILYNILLNMLPMGVLCVIFEFSAMLSPCGLGDPSV